MPDDQPPEKNTNDESPGVSRRDFLKLSGASAAALPLIGTSVVYAVDEPVTIYGPGKLPVELAINRAKHTLQLEPRTTLLDALRDEMRITSAKRVCDRGECGACTVIMDGKAVYACSVLAIEAQGKELTTIEGFAEGTELHPIQQAFVENDASQCGFCTPGFVVAFKAFLDEHPKATAGEVRHALAGNLCRCGTYRGIQLAAAQMTREGK